MAIATPTLAVTDNASSATGVVATATGADAGATVRLDYLKVDSGFDNTAGWTQGNSRTGNGTISQSLTKGIYWFRLLATLLTESAVSNLQLLAVTDGALAVHEACLQSVEAGLRTLVTAGRIPLITVADRVRGNLTELRIDRLDLPAVAVCTTLPGNAPAESLRPKVNALDDVGYPVFVLFLDRASGDYVADRPKYLKARQEIFRYFRHQRLSTVSTVYTCEPEPGPVLKFEQGGALHYLGSILTLRFWSREARG